MNRQGDSLGGRFVIQDAGWGWGPASMIGRPYSLDLRERVVAAVAAGESCRSGSQRFRSTGSPAAKRMGGHRPYALAGEREWLLARIAASPDLTLRALLAEL